jgi:sulfide:quinone oxidoreductase
MQTSRRQFFGLAAGAAALATTSPGASKAQAVKTAAKIVILGAGAAGTAAANQLAARLDGASITIVDARKQHYYQPGFTLIAAGLKPARYSVSGTGDWLPAGVTWIEEAAAEIDPVAKTVTTAAGAKVAYDYLVVATGLVLDYGAIEGMSRDLIGKNGIGSVYAGPDEAAATWAEMQRFNEKGGVALFARPATEMKCAGAPLKYAFLTEDYATRAGTRAKSKFIYAAHNKALFGVPIVSENVRMLFGARGIDTVYERVMTAIDPGRKVATFKTPEGTEEIGFDFTNVIPLMRAPDVIRNSPLPWADKWTDQGWVEVDPATLRHKRFPEIFAVGDVAGVPKGKTAASVKWQVPVAVSHLVAAIEGKQSAEIYTGYTSCPLITRVGRAMLIEFDYKDNLVPSFPGIIAPLEELWISWLMKEVALKATYNAMLRGRA